MSKIKELDAITVSKIAAGEVIDRPASVVKELIENGIDAQATQIDVVIQAGGRDLILVRDNGTGMDPVDLALAPLRHTTSKLTCVSDLMSVGSYGFRGEALASMAHVAALVLTSAIEGSSGYQVNVYQNEVSPPTPFSHPRGTTIEVRDLFFNIPVRKKFLKSDSAEVSHVLDVMTQLALIHPHIGFKLTSDGRELLNTIALTDEAQLIGLLLSKEATPHLIRVDGQVGSVRVRGMIAKPSFTFSNRSKQVMAINGRLIKNSVLQKCVMDAYRDVIPAKRFPLVVLSIEVDRGSVDVNIHPQKLDVRFINSGGMYDAVSKVLFSALGQERYAPMETTGSDHPFQYSQSSSSVAPIQAESGIKMLYDTSELKSLESIHIEFFQIFDTYIVLKTSDQLLILDQHAVHERILYEQFKRQAQGSLVTQPLLISEIVEVSKSAMVGMADRLGTLRQLGFDTEIFGDSQLVIREIPALFEGASLSRWMSEYLEFSSQFETAEYLAMADYKEKLQMKACKAAIKAGKRMPDLEVKRLLQDLSRSPANYTCPHGRPLFIGFGRSALEKLFLRS